MSNAVFCPKNRYIEAFRVGYDNIPKWLTGAFITNKISLSDISLKEEGLMFKKDLIVPFGNYCAYDFDKSEVLSIDSSQFRGNYEVKEYLGKDEIYPVIMCENFADLLEYNN